MRFLIVLVLLLVLETIGRGAVVPVEPQRGNQVAAITWTDETSAPHDLSQFAGYPTIVLPIYTRCRTACVQNVARLKQALASSAGDPRQFRVLLFSFDAGDSAATLAQYRQRESIPLGWSLAVASPREIDKFLGSLGFPVGKAGPEFTHPNLVLFLDADLRVAHWIYGTEYSAGDVDAALRIAGGGSSWVAEHSQVIYAILLFAGSLTCVAFCFSLLQLRARRRLAIGPPVPIR